MKRFNQYIKEGLNLEDNIDYQFQELFDLSIDKYIKKRYISASGFRKNDIQDGGSIFYFISITIIYDVNVLSEYFKVLGELSKVYDIREPISNNPLKSEGSKIISMFEYFPKS